MSSTNNDNDVGQHGSGSGEMISSKNECTSCEQNTITEGIDSVAVRDDVSACASCGKEGNGDDMNICNKCKMVKYCNAACKKKHRHKHKKACERYVAELHDKELFKQPPTAEDCPICFIRMPSLYTGRKYKSCCGKMICSGCIYAPVYDDQGNKVDNDKQNECAFCRVVAPKSIKEVVERLKKRVEAEDPIAIHNLGIHYRVGEHGFPQDMDKALELWHRAADLGYAEAYGSIGYAYYWGEGVEVDMKKALHYYKLAAIRGDVMARHNLGNNEYRAGNVNRALKHYKIAVRSGYSKSLKQINEMYKNGRGAGHATKDEYTKALQLYQEYLAEVKSIQRDKAAAFSDEYRYY